MSDQPDKEKKETSRISEVTSVISHQFKTPLAGIKSSLEVVLSGELGSISPEQKEYLQIALDSAQKMVILVKNLLDISAIDQNRLELHRVSTDLRKVVEDTISELAHFARAKNTTIEFQSQENVPTISIDTIKIHEVINNILYNAIRYNVGRGTIVVQLQIQGSEIIFSCKDNGIGISESESKNLFSKYYRSKRAIELATDGSGLGLYISKAIIEQSGGKIWFKSTLGEGTTFYFSLPVQ